jgi:hypothetical protein
MAEVVVTQFQLDISQYEASLAKATKGMEGFDQSADAAGDSVTNLGNDIGSASTKLKEVVTVSKAVENSFGSGLAARAKEAASLFGQLRTAAGGAIPALKSLAKEAAVIAGERFPRFAKAVDSVRTGLGKVGGAIKGAAAGVADYSKGVAGSIPVIGNLLVALGPIGIAAGAVGAGLFKIFTNLDSGATIVDGFKRSAGIAFDQVTGAASRLFSSLSSGNTIAGKVFGAIVDGIKFVNNNLNPLTIGFQKLFGEALAAGQEIAQLYDDLDEAQRGNIVQSAKARQEIARLTIQLKDRTKTEEERLAIADEITRIETQSANDRQALLKLETAAIQREIDEQTKGKQEADDDNLRRLENAKAAEVEAQTESIQILERTELRRNAIIEQGEAERKAIADKAAAARQKREQELEALAKDRAQSAQEAATLQLELQQKQELAGLEGVDRRVREVQIGYEKERQAAIKLFEEFAKLYPEDADKRAEIAQQSADAVTAITAEEIAKTEALRKEQAEEDKKIQEDRVQSFRELIVERDVLEREAINKRFDEAKEAAQKSITDAEELAKTLALIEAGRAKAFLEVKTKEQLDEEALQERRTAALLDAGKAIESLAEGIGSGAVKGAEEVGKALLDIAFKTLSTYADIALAQTTIGSLAQPDSIASFGALGIARAAIIGALIKGALAALRSTIAGSFYDGGIVGKDGGTKFSNGRDGYIARVHKGEHIMPTDITNRYMPYLEMMRDGKFEKFLSTTAQLNGYSAKATTTTATATPSFNDRRLVGALGSVGSLSEQRKQTALLAMVAQGLNRGRNARYTA